jgi:branched-subunit amino acid transport protein AzlD
MPIEKVLVAILLMGALTLLTRAFPFIFFSRRKPPKTLLFLEKYIPPMMMLILVIYCIKDVTWGQSPHGFPELIAISVVVVVHYLFNNPLFSIFGGTILYMAIV